MNKNLTIIHKKTSISNKNRIEVNTRDDGPRSKKTFNNRNEIKTKDNYYSLNIEANNSTMVLSYISNFFKFSNQYNQSNNMDSKFWYSWWITNE